jgi:multiple antibiotic resistance protein
MLAVTELAQTSSATSLGKPITAGLLVLVLLITWAMLAAADVILNLIGRTGANAVSRVLGILLTGVAVEFVVSGIRGLVH